MIIFFREWLNAEKSKLYYHIQYQEIDSIGLCRL